jgi:hypothetical protein
VALSCRVVAFLEREISVFFLLNSYLSFDPRLAPQVSMVRQTFRYLSKLVGETDKVWKTVILRPSEVDL